MLFDFAAIGPDNAYKLLVSTVVPRPIAWVTTLDTEGRVNAAPYSFFNAMANDPAVVAIGIGPKRGELRTPARTSAAPASSWSTWCPRRPPMR